jgi:hypothetical protein
MTQDQDQNVTMVAVDGRDALAYVIVKPNGHDDGVLIDAAANGMSKAQGAYVLRSVAQSWDPQHDGEAELAAERQSSTLLHRQLAWYQRRVAALEQLRAADDLPAAMQLAGELAATAEHIGKDGSWKTDEPAGTPRGCHDDRH